MVGRIPGLRRNDPTIAWLLEKSEPAVRRWTLEELLEVPTGGREARAARSEVLKDTRIARLLRGQKPDGSFGSAPYAKWYGAHWRLVSLVELGVPAGEPRSGAAAKTVLDWMTRRERPPSMGRKARYWVVHASMDGNALATASRLGLGDDPRAKTISERLVSWQRPDGGWNCDPRPGVTHSSFHESLATMWGLLEYAKATGDRPAMRAARKTGELFLSHRIFRSHRTGEVINERWKRPHYPPYWHYDIYQALLVLSRLGPIRDRRAEEALEIVERAADQRGRWVASGHFWRLARDRGNVPVEVVDWRRGRPSKIVTLNALRVLKAAGRLE